MNTKELMTTPNMDVCHYRMRDEHFLIVGIMIGVVCMMFVTMGLLRFQAYCYELDTQSLHQEYEELLAYHDGVVKEYEEKLIEVKQETAVVQAEYNQLVKHMEQTEGVEFQTLSKYWYVLRDAEPDCGLTTGMITYADALCKEKDINPDIIWTILDIESDFNPDAQNPNSTARGLGQLLSSTAKSIYENYMGNGKGTYTHNMAYNGYLNLEIVINYVEYLKDKYGDLNVMINGYSGDQSGRYYQKFKQIMIANGHNLNDLSYAGQRS